MFLVLALLVGCGRSVTAPTAPPCLRPAAVMPIRDVNGIVVDTLIVYVTVPCDGDADR